MWNSGEGIQCHYPNGIRVITMTRIRFRAASIFSAEQYLCLVQCIYCGLHWYSSGMFGEGEEEDSTAEVWNGVLGNGHSIRVTDHAMSSL